MSREPTTAQYRRYSELCYRANVEGNISDAEDEEFDRLEAIVTPWLYTVDDGELAIENHGLIPVVVSHHGSGKLIRWISDRFAVIPSHRQREVDRDTRFCWAILPFHEQPVNVCSLLFEGGKFRRESADVLKWPIYRWIRESILARRAFEKHFGSEFPDDPLDSCEPCQHEIEKWIRKLNR